MRKKLLINKNFQIKFILFMILVCFIGQAITYFALQTYFQEWVTMADMTKLPTQHPFRELIQFQRDRMNDFFFALTMVNLIVITAMGLWMGHRIAGPIHRIVNCLKDQNFNDKFSVRQNDFFKELPDAINAYLDRKKS